MFGVLIDNAIEASNEGDTVYAVLDSRDNRVLFQIKNIGPKLTPEFSSKIFQKGYTTKKEAKKSHGIGLHQLKRMTDYYHGKILLYNETDAGHTWLCFSLTI